MDHTSLYSKVITLEEMTKLMEEFSVVGYTPVIHPNLLAFSQNCRNVEILKESIQEYAIWIQNCTCWHCNELKKRIPAIGITGHDVWLRILIYINGPPQIQLN